MSDIPVARPGAARMGPIAVLPVFFKLGGKRAVLAGGSAPAVWKAELLAAAGAEVVVFATDPCADLIDLLAETPGGRIRLIPRAWRADDLDGAAIAIGAIEDLDEADRFRQAARRSGVPVNVIDKPDFCDFQFGTIVSRSPLIIGISTDGAAPVFGQSIRARIEALLPQGLTRWAEAAREWRPAVQARGLDFRRRRRFWETFTDLVWHSPHDGPAPGDLEACLAGIDEANAALGSEVALVCAGPGNPDLVTLAAIRALQAADVVFHDADIPAATIGFARREALKVQSKTAATIESDAAMIAAQLGAGRHVVWLDRGNPDICLRWQARANCLMSSGATVRTAAGLGRCNACTPTCPGWADRPSACAGL